MTKPKRGRPRKNPEYLSIDVGNFSIRIVDGKYLIYLRGNVRAIRHTEKEARDYIGMVS